MINERAPAADIAVAGSSEDSYSWGEIRGKLKNKVADLVGKTDFYDLAALIGKSSLLITGDSALLHFASAFGIPSLVIFGPTVPEFGFGPYKQENIILQAALPCRPCNIHGPEKCPLGHHDCMKNISPEEVLSAAAELLSSSSRALN